MSIDRVTLDREIVSTIHLVRQARMSTLDSVHGMLAGIINAGGTAHDCLGAVQTLREGLKAMADDSKNGAKG